MPQRLEGTKKHKVYNSTVDESTERIAGKIVDAAYAVYRKLGPGLLEKVYEICFCYELEKRGLNYKRQVVIPIVYDQLTFTEGLRLDVLVEDCIICELKALENVNPVWEAQIISHLKLTDKKLGFLINFNVSRFKGWHILNLIKNAKHFSVRFSYTDRSRGAIIANLFQIGIKRFIN